MKSKVYSVVGTGIHNQGAELMAHAIQVAISASSTPGPVLAGNGGWPIEACRRNGLLPFRRLGGRLRGPLITFLLGDVSRKSLDIYFPSDVECVFDASGFAYSDQWGPEFGHKLLKRVKSCVARDVKYVLLPQSFGPFRDQRLRRILEEALPLASRIYAREQMSLHHLEELLPDTTNVRLAPDFTGVIPGLVSRMAFECDGACILVPNSRMLDKTSSLVAGTYVRHLIALGKALERDHEVRILSHCKEDLPIAVEIARGFGQERGDVVQHRDPRIVKGIISKAAVVIGSRYHALQAALSQGVIAFALGWSHKYPDLFDGYAWSDGILDPLADIAHNNSLVRGALLPERVAAVRKRLTDHGALLQKATFEMWDEIFEDI